MAPRSSVCAAVKLETANSRNRTRTADLQNACFILYSLRELLSDPPSPERRIRFISYMAARLGRRALQLLPRTDERSVFPRRADRGTRCTEGPPPFAAQGKQKTDPTT